MKCVTNWDEWQKNKWKNGRNSFEKRKTLKKWEIWHLNLQHLLKKGSKEKDVVLGVELVARNLELWLLELNQKREPLREMKLQMKYSDLWQEFLENLQTEKIGNGIWDFADNSIEIETESNLPGSNTFRRFNQLLSAMKIIICFLLIIQTFHLLNWQNWVNWI